jgi:hypothetical protein
MRQRRILDAARHRRQRTQMEDGLGAAHGLGHNGRFGNRAVDDLDARAMVFNVGAQARAEVIENAHRVAARDEPIHEMGTNETAAASYETDLAHALIPCLRCGLLLK